MPLGNYPEPFVPATFTCSIKKRMIDLKVTEATTGEMRIKTEPRWEVKGRVNGIEYRKRFHRSGLAETWKKRLETGYAAGHVFDLRTKQFIEPVADPAGEPTSPTVFSLTEDFYRSHPEWEPKTKIIAATALNRARRWLLAPHVDLAGAELAAVEDYLAHASFRRQSDKTLLTARQAAGLECLQAHSARADEVTNGQIEEFVTRFETNQRNGKRKVSRTTIIRYTQPLRACWAWAVNREDIELSRNPWLAVKPPRKIKGKTNRAARGTSRLAVDKDVVLSVPQAVDLAERCVKIGSWGDVVRCYVLVMALCGLRPNEAVGITWADIELPEDDSCGWLTVRRSRRRVAPRWLDPEEDPEWGPLKDRDIADTRRVPIHPVLVDRLKHHRSEFGGDANTLVFQRNGRPFDLTMFARQVWDPARADMFPPRKDLDPYDPRQPKLSKLRRHDLRHAACSWWLRSGVDATVCQRWSGHKSLSVFLDVYQGVAPGREDDGVEKLIRSFSGDTPGAGDAPTGTGG